MLIVFKGMFKDKKLNIQFDSDELNNKIAKILIDKKNFAGQNFSPIGGSLDGHYYSYSEYLDNYNSFLKQIDYSTTDEFLKNSLFSFSKDDNHEFINGAILSVARLNISKFDNENNGWPVYELRLKSLNSNTLELVIECTIIKDKVR